MRRLLLLSAIVIVFSGFAPIFSKTPEKISFSQVLSPSGDQDCTLRLSFQIGKTHYWRNGLIKGTAPDLTPPMGTSPEIKNNRTFLIIRPITTEVGAKLEYWKKGVPDNPSRQDQVRITTKEGKVIDLWIGNPKAKINGVPVDIDPTDSTGKVAPYIKGKGYTMLPLRFVGDNLGAAVNWIASTQTAELVFTDGECLKKCCSYELKPASELILCPGEQRLVELSLRNLCTTKKVTFSLAPKSGVISVEPLSVTLGPNEMAVVRAGIAMPEKISDFSEFAVGISADCGLVEDSVFRALFSVANCRQACGWICGCIVKMDEIGDKVSINFDEDCDGLIQSAFAAPKELKDLLLGLSFSEYFAKHGEGVCADLCIGESGEIAAWKARPNRKTCCQERLLLTIELVDCEREMAIGVDVEGTTWVLDLASKKLCATLVPGQCYDVGGSLIKPVGSGFITSKLLKIDTATAIACAGKTVCGTVKAKNCKADPPLLMIETPDGQIIDAAVIDAMIRSQDGRFIECTEIQDGHCIHATGYEKDGVFQALSVDVLPCPCGKDLLAIDCRIASVVKDSKGELTIHARRDCNGDVLYLSAPATLGDDFGRFKNLQVFSWIGTYARLVVDGGRVIRWMPQKGCVDCNPEEFVSVISTASLGDRGLLIACRNIDGRLAAVRSARDLETGGAKLSTYRGSAKLTLDGLGTVKAWRMLEGSCCDGQPDVINPEKPAIIASDQSVEIISDPKSFACATMPSKKVESRFGFRIGFPPYPWNRLEGYGARWIEPSASFRGEAAIFGRRFCLPVCTDVELQVLSSEQTSIYLDKVDPMNLFGQVKGLSHASIVRATIQAGEHTLFFTQSTKSPGLIFAMTGAESGDCKPCAYQVSMLTDPMRAGLCGGQRKTYVAKILNFGQAKQVFRITPVNAGIVVNPSSIMVPGGSEEIFEVTVMMPPEEDALKQAFACLIEPECGKAVQWSFEVPLKECAGCSLSPETTLIRLPAMCGSDRAKIEVRLENSCEKDQLCKISTEDPELTVSTADFTAKSGSGSSFTVDFAMPKRAISRFFAGSFTVRSSEGAEIAYDVYALYKDDCCCEYEVELQTRFVAEQTMKPGDRFTYDYLVKNKCQSKKMSFAASFGSNVIKISPESFLLEPNANQPIQVTVEMPNRTADYAEFSFAIKSDCGKLVNTAFRVKYTPLSACCDYAVGIISDLPQPFMMEPGQTQMLVMGVENRCKTVTLTARMTALDNVLQIDPTTINIDPGKVTSFKMLVRMPNCKEGDKSSFRFRLAIDGCDSKEYSVPVFCGKALANCCDVGIADAWGQLASLALCPGETKSANLALVNKCGDKSISGGHIYGDRDLDVDPGTINLKPGGSMKITVTVRMPTDVKPGQDYTYIIHVNIPGCPSRQFRFTVKCVDCGGSPGICCDYEVTIISGFPVCVSPGQTFEIEVEIYNKCPNTMVFKVGGTYMVPNVLQVSVGPRSKAGMRLKVQVLDCRDQFHLEIFFSPVVPPECTENVKKIDGMIKCCQ